MDSKLKAHAKLPLILLALISVILIATAINPSAGRANWLLEVCWAIIGIIILIITYKRFPFSHLVYTAVFLHTIILVYGGYYTYANTPLGNWAMHTFDFTRNHYDRIGHLAFGFFPLFILRELYLRLKLIKPSRWLIFTLIAITLGLAATWEFIEWAGAVILAPDVGQAFLGSQGDIWDAHWDMFLAGIGAAIALLLSKWHDKSILKVPTKELRND